MVGTCCLQGRQPLPWGRSPMSFGQIGLGSVFQGKSWDKGPSSLALSRMVHHPWPAALDVIWHITLPRMVHHPLMHLYCSSRDGGTDLLSSGEAAPTMGQGPLWVSSRLANFHFSASSSWCDLAHLLQPVLLQGSFGYGPAVFRGCCSHHGAGLLWVSSRSANLHFSAGGSWCDLAHLLQAVLLQGGIRYGPAVFRGCYPYHGTGTLWVSSRSANIPWLHPPRLTFQRSGALANTPGVATTMLGIIFTRHAGYLSQT